MRYTALIVEDEINGAESLSLLLNKYCPQIEIIGIADDVEAAISAIENKKPEIVFLDIEMPSGSGFEVADRTKDIQKQIIFTTAYENYAIKALRTKAIDYLLKPIFIEDLIVAVNAAIEKIDQGQIEYLSELKKSNSANKKIAIPCSEGLLFIETDKISRIEADSNYTHLMMNDGRKITACKTLKEIETQLDSQVFFRIHNTHVVNLQKIEKYIKGDGGFVMLTDGALVPVSRAQKTLFLSRFLGN